VVVDKKRVGLKFQNYKKVCLV